MQPLGDRAFLNAYHERLMSSHDAEVTVQVLSLSERVLAQAHLIDGQVNIQPGALIRRTASLTLSDPDHSLGLDPESPWEQTLAENKLIRVRHTIEVPGYGPVTVTPFVGPVASLARDGSTVAVECQDKTALAMRGALPMRIGRGHNAVNAIRDIMADRCGERHFRLPRGIRTRLPWAVNVGWRDESSPWVACQRIARMLGMQLLYSCDGYLTLRNRPHQAVITFDEDRLTSLPTGANDFTGIVNYARVYVGSGYRAARVTRRNRLSPESLARNGVPHFLPAVEELSAPPRPGREAKLREVRAYNTKLRSLTKAAQAKANALIEPTQTDLSWSCVPVFHLDADDPVRLVTPEGAIRVAFSSGSIPLGVGGDMTGGRQMTVTRPRVRTGGRNPRRARYVPPKKERR